LAATTEQHASTLLHIMRLAVPMVGMTLCCGVRLRVGRYDVQVHVCPYRLASASHCNYLLRANCLKHVANINVVCLMFAWHRNVCCLRFCSAPKCFRWSDLSPPTMQSQASSPKLKLHTARIRFTHTHMRRVSLFVACRTWWKDKPLLCQPQENYTIC